MNGDAIASCLAGEISPPVAVARLLLGGASLPLLIDAVHGRRPPELPGDPRAEQRWRTLCGLLDARRDMLDRLAGEIAAMHPDPRPEPMGETAAFFDRAVAVSPEASVALYSLGDPAILAEATAEIMAWLDGQGCLLVAPDALDLGCGIGRIAAALAPRCRSVLGLDVSAGMVAAARRRCAGVERVRFEQTPGTDLDGLADAAFDLVIAVDSFPYILHAGAELTARHISGAARVLRSGGRLVILNLSYGRDLAADRADARDWSARHGFTLSVAGERPFALWDGAAFVLQKG